MRTTTFLSEKEQQICDKAFSKMNDQFSSRQFGKALRHYGLTTEFILCDKAYTYLKMNARIIKGTKSYIKNVAKNIFTDIQNNNENDIVSNDIDQAIKLLINTGKYKIYIKTEEFKEII